MRKSLPVIVCMLLGLVLAVGCKSYAPTVRIDTMAIPDQTYQVTVHETQRLYYAVLFDIPDDGVDVDLFYTYATHIIGPDTPGVYLDRFTKSIKGYRTLQINDRDGNTRGYLVISNLLGYLVYEKPARERLIVQISDPNLTSAGLIRIS